ncbi:MAG: DUF488 domain-containing protein [Verrucomicrobia bacterium]|nr:DUF488 domain-containing protein [Verrucomicrobiota bacterium]
MKKREKTIYTIGHSNRPLEDLVSLLQAHQIGTVIDIRSIPRSRHNPQFNKDKLKRSLKKEKIRYVHIEKLGGLRHPKKNSLNTGWENASFRGFADYMQTADFREGIKELIELAKAGRCALMCAEAVPWRCHRSLVADALTVKKWEVRHIQSRKTAKKHELTAFLRIKGRRLIYA